jgi:cell filamentation protein
MDRVEYLEFVRATYESIQAFRSDQRLTASDFVEFHRAWLEPIYPWAGEYRQVNMSKGGFLFAAAGLVPALMHQFQRDQLARYTPCAVTDRRELARAIGETHAEFILVHPFREGNGRVARHFANLMMRQAGRDSIDFDSIVGERRLHYFAAIQAAVARDYDPIQEIFEELINASERPGHGCAQ